MKNMIERQLQVAAKALENYKNKFDIRLTSDELFENFKCVLEKDLKNYELAYDYLCGKQTTEIDGVTRGYRLQKGDTIVLDVSIKYDGVWCDVCRTFFVGTPAAEQVKAYKMLQDSVRAGEKLLIPGTKASAIYEAMNRVFKKSGYVLFHHGGHGVGEQALMEPRFVADSDERIEKDKIYTIESGVYDNFGIRMENDYFTGENGTRDLFEKLMPLDMKEYIL